MSNVAKKTSALHLVFGAASSGKSAFAEAWIESLAAQRLYVATALAGEAEMNAKIAAHQARRGSGWDTLELGGDADAPDLSPYPDHAVLFDCATLWLGLRADGDWQGRAAELLDMLRIAPNPVVIVSNELGMGLVPTTPEARQFRDAHGQLNQMIAAQADTVIMVAAGLPLALKGTLP